MTSAPIIGSTWDPVIDHTVFLPGAALDFVGITASPANIPLPPLGTLLCDPALVLSVEASPSGVPF